MVRTRRQAARQGASQPEPQPEPATTEPSADSDSDSEVNDIPASGRRSKVDPARLGTLRPAADGVARPKLLLDPKKRRVAATQSPSVAKKRRTESAMASGTSKRRKTIPADAVNPLAMAVLNQFNKNARSTTRRTQAAPLRRITIELQSRTRGGTLRIAREDQDPHDIGQLSREEPEEQPEEESEQEDGQEQARAPPHTESEPTAEQRRNPAPESAAQRTEHDAGELPPRSGQGSQREAPSQRTPRKSKRRVTKPAFNERPAVQEPARSVSKPTSAAPRPSQQPRAAGPSDGHDDREPVASAAPEWTVQVPSNEIRSMCFLMATKAWTGIGPRWPTELAGSGLRTCESYQHLYKVTDYLRNKYMKAPRGLAHQEAFLQGMEERTEELMAGIADEVKDVCEQYNANVRRKAEDNDQVTLGHLEKEDLLQRVIPLLVLLLRGFFFLGGSQEGEGGDLALPEETGTFTARSLQLLRQTCRSISRLAKIIRRETEQSPLALAPDEDEDEGRPDEYRKRLQKRAQQRITFHDTVSRFLKGLKQAEKTLDEDRDRETRKREMLERAEKEKAEKEREERKAREKRQERQRREDEQMAKWEREEEEERARKERRLEAVCLSTQRLRDELPPFSSSMRPSKAQQPQGDDGRNRDRSPELGGFLDERRVYRLEPRERVRGHELRPWTDLEAKFLVRKLREGGRPDYDTWAEDLQRPVHDVRREVELLKFSVRDIAAKMGKLPYAWARA